MKISASIYSDKQRPLKEVITDLADHQVELLHVDCNDDLSVFDDIKAIRLWCELPIDLHIITDDPEKYYDYLREVPVEYVTFQFEDLKTELRIPDDISGKRGIAVTTNTSIDVFDQFPDFDFILIMATVPGKSGGEFDKINFDKIRNFRRRYPSKSIHVDGGVNAEVSFILRNMGVTSSVSGSYLFKSKSVGNALMNLTKREVESHFKIKDFMIPLDQAPVVNTTDLNLRNALKSIEDGRFGFTMVTSDSGIFKGIISNADVRKGLLKHLNDLSELTAEECINTSPKTILEESTVLEMLQLIKGTSFPIMYLPVLNKDGFATGIVTFVNLIKGEL